MTPSSYQVAENVLLQRFGLEELARMPLVQASQCDPCKPKKLREALGITIRQIADELQVDHTYVSRLETGYVAWSLYVAIQWLDYMALHIARRRIIGEIIPDSAIPTLRELATIKLSKRQEARLHRGSAAHTPDGTLGTRRKPRRKRKGGSNGKSTARGHRT